MTDSIVTGGWGAHVPAAGRSARNAQTGLRETDPGRDGAPGGSSAPDGPRYAGPSASGRKSGTARFGLDPASPVLGRGSSVTGSGQLPGAR